MKDWSLGTRQVGIVDCCFLGTFFCYCQLLLLRIDFFLGFRFGLGIVKFGFFCNVVQVKHFLACLGFPPEDLPQFLQFL
jgi:hypothetical protein